MKKSRTKKIVKKKPDDEKRWADAAKIFENSKKFNILKNSTMSSPLEHRKILGSGKKKLISIRVPEIDLQNLKEMAMVHDRSYQQLIIQAIENYIDANYEKIISKK